MRNIGRLIGWTVGDAVRVMIVTWKPAATSAFVMGVPKFPDAFFDEIYQHCFEAVDGFECTHTDDGDLLDDWHDCDLLSKSAIPKYRDWVYTL
jgi:hypothetical protein